MLLVAAAVVASVQALGSLLVVAVLVAPAACARLLTRRVAPMLWREHRRGDRGRRRRALPVVLRGLAAGASIALCLVGGYLAALALDLVARSRAPS